MKQLLLLASVVMILTSCEKEPPPVVIENPVEDTLKYAGVYNGWVEKQSSGVDSFGVYKTDTAYVYTVEIKQESFGTVTIKGSTNSGAIPVDSNGYFYFSEFNHNIEGNFTGDSLYLFTESISGSYDPPQFYDNTQMSFSGKKVQ